MTLFSNPLPTPLLTRPLKNYFYRHFGVSESMAKNHSFHGNACGKACVNFLALVALNPTYSCVVHSNCPKSSCESLLELCHSQSFLIPDYHPGRNVSLEHLILLIIFVLIVKHTSTRILIFAMLLPPVCTRTCERLCFVR